jgi:hypothetical protein
VGSKRIHKRRHRKWYIDNLLRGYGVEALSVREYSNPALRT